jgi:hypothetical protein
MNKNLFSDEVYGELVKIVSASYSGILDDVTAGQLLAKVKVAQMRMPAQAPARMQQADPEIVEERLQMLRETLSQFLQENNLSGDRNALGLIDRVVGAIRPALQHSLIGEQSTWQRMQQVPKVPKPGTPQAPGMPANNANPEPNSQSIHDMFHDPQSVRASIDSIVRIAVSLADKADEAGLHDKADAISSILPTLGLIKMAQHEHIEHYWVANGRAFEKAFREKVKSNKTPHEAWFAVLEEYQDSLLTDQNDFLDKYASRKGDKTAGKVLLAKITDNIEAGSPPGVAFYEAIDDFVTGKYAARALASLKSAARDLQSCDSGPLQQSAAEAEIKIAGIWDSMKSMLGFGGGMGSSWSDPAGSWAEKSLIPYVNGGPVVSEFQKIRHQWENSARPWLTGVAPHQAQITRMEYSKHMQSMLSSLEKVVGMARKAGFDLKVPHAPAVEMAGNQVIVNKAELARFTQELFQDLRPFMDDQLALAIQKKTQARDPRADKAQKTKDWWKNKKNPQAPAAPAAVATPWNPAPTGDLSWQKGNPSSAPSRLAPHEVSVLEKAVQKNNLPPQIKTKLLQFMSGTRAAAAVGVKNVTAAPINYMDQGPQTVVQPSATPGNASDLQLGGNASPEKIRAALQQFFETEYPEMGFMSSHLIDKLMTDVQAEMGDQAKPAPAPEAAPVPAPAAQPVITSPQAASNAAPAAPSNPNASPLTDGPSSADFHEMAKAPPAAAAAPAPAPAPVPQPAAAPQAPVLNPAPAAPGASVPSVKKVRKSPVGTVPR